MVGNSDHPPKVSCVMVTANRLLLCRRAINCYKKQTYLNKELIIVDDGIQDLSSELADFSAGEVVYHKIDPDPANVLGKLRNLTLDLAGGDYIAQWDDDDWYHPDRLAKQVEALELGYDACTLSGAIMHLDAPEYFDHPYIGYLKSGVPGTIVHRRDPSIRYPEVRKAEDTTFLQNWLRKKHLKLPESMVYLFIRCFHGNNTWDQNHFLTRIRNTPGDLFGYAWHRHVRGDLFGHARFQLDTRSLEAFQMYLADSAELGLFPAGN